jgi:hypothetical protein
MLCHVKLITELLGVLTNTERENRFMSNNQKIFPTKPLPDRNEKCPCGSGKKYKKCCMEKDKQAYMDIIQTISDNPAMRERSAVTRRPTMLHPWQRESFTGVGKYARKEDTQTQSKTVKSEA